MKRIGCYFFLFAFFKLLSTTSFSQDLSGIWRGYFISEGGDQYKYEVQIKQTKTGLSGVTYSYLDTRFYGKTTFVGNYTKASSAALVQELKTIELKMTMGSMACIMKNRLIYSRSGKEEFLEGNFTSAYEKSEMLSGIRRGGNCGGGKVFLRKVPTSDFYVEPFLRNKKLNTTPTTETAKTPPAKKPAVASPPVKAPGTNTTPKNNPKMNQAAVKKPENKPVIVEPEKKATDVVVNTKPIEPKIIPTPITIRDRKNELAKLITVNNSEIEISLYDNGEIDGDTVSIYLDGKLILANKGLSNVPIKYKLVLDESNPEHTLVMVAENMGSIPPNTSLMLIQDGDKRYQVSIVSTEQKNAMVRFRYEKPKS